jgi:hypothetical protein
MRLRRRWVWLGTGGGWIASVYLLVLYQPPPLVLIPILYAFTLGGAYLGWHIGGWIDGTDVRR